MSVSGKFRPVAVLFGIGALFVVVFQLAERVTGPPERSSAAAESDVSGEPGEPISIEIRRPGPNSLQITVGGMHTSTVRLDSEHDGNIDDVVACLEEGIERAEAEGVIDLRPPDSWWARQAGRIRVSEQVSQIQHRCFSERIGGMTLPELPSLDPPPPPPPPPVSR